uniref:Uncharacterized protein n=1 Tax=Panagrolaimus davidi TaxID=227884 RepID=A0A914Q583_9BILA
MSSNPAVAAASTAETEFKTKTFFTRALMLSKFLQIGINKPKTWLKNGLKFLSNQLMFIAVGICAVIGVASIIIQFGKQEIPLTFFTEYKVEIFGRVQCCAKNHCHNVSRIGVDLLDDNICKY